MPTPAPERTGDPSRRPCVLLVEDNDPLRLFIEMALEERSLDVVACPRVADARAVLEHRPVDLLLTDLMLPGESGLDLVRSLRERADALAALPVITLTAGATPAQREALAALGVLDVITKPASVETLLAAVDGALGASSMPALPPESRPGPATPAAFGGDHALYLAFLQSCREQFALDLLAGDRAAAQGDTAAMRHLAHSLKGVLASLDELDDATAARQLEEAAAAGDAEACRRRWPGLRDALARLRAA